MFKCNFCADKESCCTLRGIDCFNHDWSHFRTVYADRHCPTCGLQLNVPTDEPMSYCPVCGKEVFTSCPECGSEVSLEYVVDESASGFLERLYNCYKCGSAWITREIDGEENPPQRYFFG